MVHTTNANTFENDTKSGIVLVDFWAEWCGPCRMMHPVLEEISEELPNVVIFKLNIEENKELTSAFKIMSIPAFLLFKDGKHIDTLIGGHDKEEMIDWINQNV